MEVDSGVCAVTSAGHPSSIATRILHISNRRESVAAHAASAAAVISWRTSFRPALPPPGCDRSPRRFAVRQRSHCAERGPTSAERADF